MTPELYTTAAGKPRWKVRFWLDKRQTSKTFGTDAGAREFVRLVSTFGASEACRILDERTSVQAGTRTLADYAEHHVDTLTGVGEDYRRRCRRMIANDLDTLGVLPLTAITRESVARWVNAMAATGVAGKTIKNKHGFLSAVLRHAVLDGIIGANPCEGTRLPRTVAHSMTFLTPEEYAVFLGYFTPRWQPMVALMFGTGARFSELTALTVGDVDLNAATVTITKAWKDNGSIIGAPKSKRSVRTLSLAPETIDVLRPLVEGRRPADRLLTNTVGGPVRLQTFHDNAWQPAVRLANGEPGQRPGAKAKRVARRIDATGQVIAPATVPLGKRPRPHDARHSCASWLLASGAPLNVVQDHLGHESITTTSDRYGHLMPSAKAAVANALSLALSPAHPQIES